MRVHLSNLGCKLNQAEIERLARDFANSGYSIVGELGDADLHVVNSCTVTHVAARDSRKLARRAGRTDRNIKTVLTGCYVNGSPEEAAALAGVDLVVPNERKERLVAEVTRAFPELTTRSYEAAPPSPYMPFEHLNTRALVKVEDGCNMPCTFCIIPSTRGAQRSRPLHDVVTEVETLVDGGYKEIVVTGVQISSYRWQGVGLYDLVTTLLARTTVPRLRLTSIAPWQFDDRLLDLFNSGRLCRHFHLSLQSGCDSTLERMRRPYSVTAFSELVSKIRDRVPGTAVTTDVIVGFPGETENDFADSLAFIRRMRFARIHAFPYSSRPGTAAEILPGEVSHQIKKDRMAKMLSVARQAERAFWNDQLGREVEILWEGRKNGSWSGMSDNYIRTFTRSAVEVNSLGRATLTHVLEQGVEARHDRGSNSHSAGVRPEARSISVIGPEARPGA